MKRTGTILRRYMGAVVCVCALLCMLYSCKPRGVMSSRKMVEVLTDLHRMDGMLQVRGHRRNAELEEAMYYDAVLAKHGVDRSELDSSLVWYTHHPQRMNKLYPRVIAQLEQEHSLFVSESEQQRALLFARKAHFDIFTYEIVRESVLHGYPLLDYAIRVDTLWVQPPLIEEGTETP